MVYSCFFYFWRDLLLRMHASFPAWSPSILIWIAGCSTLQRSLSRAGSVKSRSIAGKENSGQDPLYIEDEARQTVILEKMEEIMLPLWVPHHFSPGGESSCKGLPSRTATRPLALCESMTGNWISRYIWVKLLTKPRKDPLSSGRALLYMMESSLSRLLSTSHLRHRGFAGVRRGLGLSSYSEAGNPKVQPTKTGRWQDLTSHFIIYSKIFQIPSEGKPRSGMASHGRAYSHRDTVRLQGLLLSGRITGGLGNLRTLSGCKT